MKKILLSSAAAAALVVSMNAKTITITDDLNVSFQASSQVTYSYTGAADLNFTVTSPYNANDLIYYKLSSGTWNTDGTYYLICDQGGNGSNTDDDENMTALSTSGGEILFRVPTAGIDANSICSLTTTTTQTSWATANDDVNFSSATLSTAGETITLDVETYLGSTSTEIDTGTATAVATAIDQFDANVSTLLDGVIDVAGDRLVFTTATNGSTAMDSLEIGFTNYATSADLDHDVVLTASDTISISLSGSTTGVTSATLTGVNNTLDGVVGTDAITFSGSSVEIGTTNDYDLNITTDGTTTLQTRTFTISSSLELSDESLIEALHSTATAAGKWTVNGATYDVINMANSGSSVTTAIRLMNDSTSSEAEVYVTPTIRTAGKELVCDEFQMSGKTIPTNGSIVLTAAEIIAEAANTDDCTDLSSGDDFSVQIMVTVPRTSSDAIAVQRSGTGQRVLGNTVSDFSAN